MKSKLELVALYAKRIKEMDHYNAIPEGFYMIQDILEFGVNNSGFMNLKVTALWHPTDKNLGESSYSIMISLNGLFLRESVGPKELNFKPFISGIIHVKKAELFDYEYGGQKKKSFKAEWAIIKFPNEEIK